MAKIPVSLRIEKESLSLLNKIAKEEYGSDKRKGFVIENAIQIYQSHRTRPAEAAAVLSVTEEKIIERLDKRFHDIGEKMVNRIGNLIAKESYETALQSLLMESVYYKAGYKKTDYEYKRKEAASRMKGRLDKEQLSDLSGIIEENEQLKQTNEKINLRLMEAAKAFQSFKEENERLEKEKEELLAVKESNDYEYKQLQNWTNGLVNYLRDNGKAFKSNASLIEEYTKANPAPKRNIR